MIAPEAAADFQKGIRINQTEALLREQPADLVLS